MNESSQSSDTDLASSSTVPPLTAEQRDALARVYRFLLSLRAEKAKVERGTGQAAPEDASQERKSDRRTSELSEN